MRQTFNERIATVEHLRDAFEADRERLERKIATLQIERNELGRAMRSNSDTCHRALERAIEDGDKELKQWLASTRTDETPRPPNPVVIARYLFETTDFGDWLAAKLDEAIAADTETFDPRSTRQLKKLHAELDAQLIEARAELKGREEACLAAGAAVRAAERGDVPMMDRFLRQHADDAR
jgi:molybdopterin converting factor small subunit